MKKRERWRDRRRKKRRKGSEGEKRKRGREGRKEVKRKVQHFKILVLEDSSNKNTKCLVSLKFQIKELLVQG